MAKDSVRHRIYVDTAVERRRRGANRHRARVQRVVKRGVMNHAEQFISLAQYVDGRITHDSYYQLTTVYSKVLPTFSLLSDGLKDGIRSTYRVLYECSRESTAYEDALRGYSARSQLVENVWVLPICGAYVFVLYNLLRWMVRESLRVWRASRVVRRVIRAYVVETPPAVDVRARLPPRRNYEAHNVVFVEQRTLRCSVHPGSDAKLEVACSLGGLHLLCSRCEKDVRGRAWPIVPETTRCVVGCKGAVCVTLKRL